MVSWTRLHDPILAEPSAGRGMTGCVCASAGTARQRLVTQPVAAVPRLKVHAGRFATWSRAAAGHRPHRRHDGGLRLIVAASPRCLYAGEPAGHRGIHPGRDPARHLRPALHQYVPYRLHARGIPRRSAGHGRELQRPPDRVTPSLDHAKPGTGENGDTGARPARAGVAGSRRDRPVHQRQLQPGPRALAQGLPTPPPSRRLPAGQRPYLLIVLRPGPGNRPGLPGFLNHRLPSQLGRSQRHSETDQARPEQSAPTAAVRCTALQCPRRNRRPVLLPARHQQERGGAGRQLICEMRVRIAAIEDVSVRRCAAYLFTRAAIRRGARLPAIYVRVGGRRRLIGNVARRIVLAHRGADPVARCGGGALRVKSRGIPRAKRGVRTEDRKRSPMWTTGSGCGQCGCASARACDRTGAVWPSWR